MNLTKPAAAEARHTATAMRVWVACLASYNDGDLVGEWITPAEYDTADDLAAAIESVIHGEEYGVFDYDNIPAAVAAHLGEYPTAETLHGTAKALADLEEQFDYDPMIITAAFVGEVVNPTYDEPGTWAELIADRYLAHGETAKDLVMDYVADAGIMADDHPMFPFIDWDHYARELEIEGYVFVHLDGGVYMFAPSW